MLHNIVHEFFNDPDCQNVGHLHVFFRGERKHLDYPIEFHKLESTSDYELIIKRELSKRGENDTPEFRDYLIRKIEKWKASYIKFHEKYDYPDNDFLNNVNNFILYAKGQYKGPIHDTPKKKPETLKDIWAPGKEKEYDRLINFLKTPNHFIGDIAFIQEIDGNFNWNNNHGANKYLAGLFHVLTEKRMLIKYFNAPDYQRIALNTFNHPLNDEPFKGLSKFKVHNDVKYTKPFENFQGNLS